MTDVTIITVAAVYFVAVLGIGVWAARRTKTHEDYYIAGKGVGLIAIALATMSSAMSGFLFIGGPGIMYSLGFGTLLLTFPGSVSFALAWYLVAKRMRLLAQTRSAMTVPDAVHARFQSDLARGAAAAAVLFGVVGYLAVQVGAMGVILAFIFDTSFEVGVLLGVGIVVSYSVAGGMIAGVYTDVVQGMLMVVAAGVIFFLALSEGGGLGNMVAGIAEASPDYVGPWGLLPAAIPLGWYLVFSLGILGQPHIVHKFYMINDPRRMKWGALLAAAAGMVASLVMLSVGLAMRYFAEAEGIVLATPDDAAPTFMADHAPSLLAGLFFAGVAAASMSTADSFLNIGSAAIVRDLPLAFGRETSPRTQFVWGRITTALIGVAAGLFVLGFEDILAAVGIFGWTILAAALAPSLGLGLNWKRATKWGAVSSIATGLVVGGFLGLNNSQGWFPDLLPGHLYWAALVFLLSFLVFIVVSLLTPRQALPADVEVVMDL